MSHTGKRLTVGDLFPNFQREGEPHKTLRRLRAAQFIYPKKTGRWEPDEPIAVTPFGRMMWDQIGELRIFEPPPPPPPKPKETTSVDAHTPPPKHAVVTWDNLPGAHPQPAEGGRLGGVGIELRPRRFLRGAGQRPASSLWQARRRRDSETPARRFEVKHRQETVTPTKTRGAATRPRPAFFNTDQWLSNHYLIWYTPVARSTTYRKEPR